MDVKISSVSAVFVFAAGLSIKVVPPVGEHLSQQLIIVTVFITITIDTKSQSMHGRSGTRVAIRTYSPKGRVL